MPAAFCSFGPKCRLISFLFHPLESHVSFMATLIHSNAYVCAGKVHSGSSSVFTLCPLLRIDEDAHSSYDHFRLNGPPPPLLTSLHPLFLLSSKFSLLQHLSSFTRSPPPPEKSGLLFFRSRTDFVNECVHCGKSTSWLAAKQLIRSK